MKVVVTFALDAEFGPWRRLQRFEEIQKRGPRIFEMRNGDAEIYSVITGVGAPRLAPVFTELLQAADIFVASGLAGSLRKQHAAGTVLVARAVKPTSNDRTIRSNEELIKRAIDCGATPADVFCTTDRVVTFVSDKSRLGRIADAVDMETFQLMAEARNSGVPAVAIRAVSDAADHTLPLDFNQALDGAGNIEWIRVLSQAIASPLRLPELLRFGLESSKAARKLGTFLDRYLKCLISEAQCDVTSKRLEVR